MLKLVSVEVVTDSMFVRGQETVLFPLSGLGISSWDVAPGDERFIWVRARTDELNYNFIIVQNFFEELKAKVGN